MKRKLVKLLLYGLPSLGAVLGINHIAKDPGQSVVDRVATGLGLKSTTLGNVVISADPDEVRPVDYQSLLQNGTITVYAVGLDEKGNVIPIPTESEALWSGSDVLEVKPMGPHAATVKLLDPLKVAAADISVGITHQGRSLGSGLQIPLRHVGLPKSFFLVLLGDPASDKVLDVQRMRVGESITVFLRAMSIDVATAGQLFPLPHNVNIDWSIVPAPLVADNIRIVPMCNHAARIDVVKNGDLEGLLIFLQLEARFRDGTTKPAVLTIEIID